MNRVILIGLGIIIIFAGILAVLKFPEKSIEGLDEFALCLKEKNVIMYGAEWCPHCQNEKRAFGDSFRFVPYVECPDNPQKCLAAGISGYPTWVFPASSAGEPDGKKLEGEQGIERLAQESGCSVKK